MTYPYLLTQFLCRDHSIQNQVEVEIADSSEIVISVNSKQCK